jgi:hypothetical protein
MKGDKTMFENQLGLQEQLDVMKQYGIVFDTGAPIRGILANDSIDQLANDAAMVTAANSGIPVEFTSYIDPMVIPILTATRGAREIFGEAKKGDWTTSYARFQTSEITGEVEAYTDYGQGGASDVNPTFPVRTQYIYQTNIRYGDREVDVASRARLQLAADKQRAAATVIDIASNKFALYGVAGLEIYGLLNDPNLPASVSPLPNAASKALWADKSTKEIYEDVLYLFGKMADRGAGHIDANTELVLATSPATQVQLGRATDFNISARQMLETYFPKIRFVALPELATTTGGTSILLVAPTIEGLPTAQIGFSEKFRAMRLIPESSSFHQKFVGSSYGTIIYRPFAIGKMTGV